MSVESLNGEFFTPFASTLSYIYVCGSGSTTQPLDPPLHHLPHKGLDEAVDGEEDLIRALLRPALGEGEDGPVHIVGVGHDVHRPSPTQVVVIIIIVVVTDMAAVVVVVADEAVLVASHSMATTTTASD